MDSQRSHIHGTQRSDSLSDCVAADLAARSSYAKQIAVPSTLYLGPESGLKLKFEAMRPCSLGAVVWFSLSLLLGRLFLLLRSPHTRLLHISCTPITLFLSRAPLSNIPEPMRTF